MIKLIEMTSSQVDNDTMPYMIFLSSEMTEHCYLNGIGGNCRWSTDLEAVGILQDLLAKCKAIRSTCRPEELKVVRSQFINAARIFVKEKSRPANLCECNGMTVKVFYI